MTDLQQALDKVRSDLEALAAGVKHYMDVHDHLVARQNDLEAEVKRLGQEVANLERAAALLHALSNLSREQLCSHLSHIVTTALQYVYGPDFRFELELSTDKRGNTKLDYYVISGDGIRTRPQDARGGGVVDVISIALRVGILSLMNNPPLPGPIILDEPGRHLDPESAVKLGEFLRFIAETTGRQFIVITHHETLIPYAHAAFRVSQGDSVSQVERIL